MIINVALATAKKSYFSFVISSGADFFTHLQTVEELGQALDALCHLKICVLAGELWCIFHLVTNTGDQTWLNLWQHPFGVSSSEVNSRAPQHAVRPGLLTVRPERGGAHTERAQIVGWKRTTDRIKCQCFYIPGHVSKSLWVEFQFGNFGNLRTNIPEWHSECESFLMTHVQTEIPARCCRGCCSCSPLVLERENFDFVQRGHHEPAKWWSGSLLQKQGFVDSYNSYSVIILLTSVPFMSTVCAVFLMMEYDDFFFMFNSKDSHNSHNSTRVCDINKLYFLRVVVAVTYSVLYQWVTRGCTQFIITWSTWDGLFKTSARWNKHTSLFTFSEGSCEQCRSLWWNFTVSIWLYQQMAM